MANDESKNQIAVDVHSFNAALKSFKTGMPRKKGKVKPSSPAMLSFNDGYLTIMWDDITINLNAVGEWQGKAEFNCSVIFAMVMVPMTGRELTIKYENQKLYFGSTSIPCRWTSVSREFISKVENPDAVEIFAMWRSMPALALEKDEVGVLYNYHFKKMLVDTEKYAKQLRAYKITQDDLINLIESKIDAELKN